MKTEDRRFTLDELATLAELPRRTVRYYIQTGLLERPDGLGRGAHYTRQHVDQLVRIRKWQLAGLSLERIAELLQGGEKGVLPPTPRRAGSVEVWSHLVVADGVEIHVEPGRAKLKPEQVRAFFREAGVLYQRIQREG